MWSSKDWGPVDIPPSQKEEAHRTETTFTGISASQPSFIHSFIHSTVFISINYVPAQIGNDKLRKEKNKTRQRRWQRQARWLYYYVSGEQGWPHWLDDIWAETGRKRGYRSRSHLMEEQSRQWEQQMQIPWGHRTGESGEQKCSRRCGWSVKGEKQEMRSERPARSAFRGLCTFIYHRPWCHSYGSVPLNVDTFFISFHSLFAINSSFRIHVMIHVKLSSIGPTMY